MSRRRAFYTRKLIVYENGEYAWKNNFSDRAMSKIMKNLTEDERMALIAFNQMFT
jgi:hypothetical protein